MSTDDIIREYEERDQSEDSGAELSDTEQNDNNAGLQFSDNEQETKNDENEKADEKKPAVDKPKRKGGVRIDLSVEQLKHKTKGVHKIEDYFVDFKFRGKGHEKEDLDRVMKRLEHWSHRLFSKYTFDSNLERIEQIGMKKVMNTFLVKYRQDMLTEEDETAKNYDEEEEEVNDVPMQNTAEDRFNELQEHAQIRSQINQKPSESRSALSDEIRERIERNKQIALEKKKARMLEKQRETEQMFNEAVSQSVQENTSEDGMTMQQKIEMKKQMALARKLARQKEKEYQSLNYGNESLNFDHESQDLSNTSQNFGNESQNICDKSQNCDNETSKLENESLNVGNKSQNLSNENLDLDNKSLRIPDAEVVNVQSEKENVKKEQDKSSEQSNVEDNDKIQQEDIEMARENDLEAQILDEKMQVEEETDGTLEKMDI